MDRCCDNPATPSCALRYVCRCLRVTEEALAEAVATRPIHSVKDIRRHTGAGDGCMACHKKLAQYVTDIHLAAAS